MKKVFISILLLCLLLGTGYYVYSDFIKKEEINKSPLLSLSSKNLVAIISGDNIFKKMHQFFTSSLVWKELSRDPNLSHFEDDFSMIDSVFEKSNVAFANMTLGLYRDSMGNFDFKLVAEISEAEFKILIENTNLFSRKSLSTLNKSKQFVLNAFNKNFLGFFENGRIILASREKMLGEVNRGESILGDESYTKMLKSTNKGGVLLSLNLYQLKEISSIGNSLMYNLRESDWAILEFRFNEDKIVLQGLGERINRFNGGEESITNFLELLPNNVESFKLVCGDKLKKEVHPDIVYVNDTLCSCDFWEDGFYWLDDLAFYFTTNFGSNKYLVFKLLDRHSFKEGIFNVVEKDSTYYTRDSVSNIYGINPIIEFSQIFQIEFEPSFYSFINEYVVFSNSLGSLKILQKSRDNKTTLAFNDKLVDYISEVETKKAFSVIFSKGFLFNKGQDFQGVSLFESSQKSDSLIYLTYSYSTAYNIGRLKNDALWEMTFDNPLYDEIYLIDNHRVNGKEVLIQDTSNKIHLISSAGEIKWSYQLDGKIKDEPIKLDIYKNGKFQMLFNTSSKIYALDVLGRDVKGFPINVPSMTNSVNAFDYDNNGDYRIFVATVKGIFVYDKIGEEVSGWKQPLTDFDVHKKIRHLRVGGKDYILVNDKVGKIYLYSRQGDIRHKIDKKYTPKYFPVDFGNTITSTRAIYSKENKLVKHFFDNKNAITIHIEQDSIYNFFYQKYNNSVDKHWFITMKDRLKVYNKSGVQLNDLTVTEGFENLKIYNSVVYYNNPFSRELVVNDLLNDSENYYNESESYTVDHLFEYDRLYLKQGKKLQMVIHRF